MTRTVLLIILFSIVSVTYAQGDKGKKFPTTKEEKARLEEGDALMDEGNYEAAFKILQEMEKDNPNASELLYRLGICMYRLDRYNVESSLAYFNRANPEELKNTTFGYHYGKALHKNYEFEKAITQLEMVSKSKAKLSKEQKAEIPKLIRYCRNGIELVKRPANVEITTLGDPLNTSGSEYAPIISADEKTILFTYAGERSTGGLQRVQGERAKIYYEDVMISYKDSLGQWSEPKLLPSNINTEGNDACVAMTPDAQYIYLFRGSKRDPEGSLYKSELDGYTWTDPEFLKGEINSDVWDGSITISHDGRRVYFASERPGGMGGRDLYEARKLPNGTWGKVKNLGPAINTKEDDDAPFLHPSGKYLVFSSEGHNSMGAADIFVSELNPDSTWGAPVNIGYPINSPNADKFYTVTADGKHGYYSSSKKGGMGKQDIYMVAPGIDKNVVLMQVVGDVFLDDVPTFCEIKVTDSNTPPLTTLYNSNSYSGKFLLDLPPTKKYTITFEIGGMKPLTYEVDASDIDGFVEKYLLVKFYTNGESKISEPGKYLPENPPVKDTAKTATNNTITNPPVNKDTIMKMAELMDFKHPDLQYRVQVGAYRYPQNFKVQKYERDEKSRKELLNDGITRFTIKTFGTLREAYAYRDEMVKLGVSDAFVTGLYKGKRYLLVELRPILNEVLRNENR